MLILAIETTACKFPDARRGAKVRESGLADITSRFCGEDEDNDPSPEFEEMLACAACGDNGASFTAQKAKLPLSRAKLT